MISDTSNPIDLWAELERVGSIPAASDDALLAARVAVRRAATTESLRLDVLRVRRRRQMRIATASLVAAAAVGSGAAYAGGLVPQFVTDAFDRLDSSSPEKFDVSGTNKIANFTIPDGTRYTVWRGKNNAGGSCEAIKEDRPGDDQDNFHAGCFSSDSKSIYEQVTFNWVQLPEGEGVPQNPMYFVAYGEAPNREAASVRINGDGTDVTMPIDPATGGFGGNLPNFMPPPDGMTAKLTFTFHDGGGQVVGTAHYGQGNARASFRRVR